jgi:acetylornithine/succinyldiaminopimelate/putrescine aminotransferase
VSAVQGEGFLLGLRTRRPAKQIQAELLRRGILTGTASDPEVVRLLPPFILKEAQVDLLSGALADLGA